LAHAEQTSPDLPEAVELGRVLLEMMGDAWVDDEAQAWAGCLRAGEAVLAERLTQAERDFDAAAKMSADLQRDLATARDSNDRIAAESSRATRERDSARLDYAQAIRDLAQARATRDFEGGRLDALRARIATAAGMRVANGCYEGDDDSLVEAMDGYRKRHDRIVEEIAALRGWADAAAPASPVPDCPAGWVDVRVVVAVDVSGYNVAASAVEHCENDDREALARAATLARAQSHLDGGDPIRSTLVWVRVPRPPPDLEVVDLRGVTRG
jgi:hypothetical protein